MCFTLLQMSVPVVFFKCISTHTVISTHIATAAYLASEVGSGKAECILCTSVLCTFKKDSLK